MIGGWVFLSNGYALGGDSSRYRWAFDTKLWWFTVFNTEMTFTNQQIFGDTGVVATASNTFDWRILGYIYSGVITIVLVVLRQLFAGFWFHPLGFILGTPGITGGYIWGSALLAWLVRMGVLRIGGAATVREKLMPFAIGVFLGAVLGFIILWGYGGYLTHLGIDRIYGDIP